ncbi:unnamed protein product [Schistosoma haematobium]|nr:unnamed protein product [Schistosoma haematobium]CAH8545896.1 unnamed protein product [Schistosoma haematobium]
MYLRKTIDILCDYISLMNNLPLPLPVNTLKDLLLLCTNNVKFTFEGVHFAQIDGTALGSPLGPLLADVFMGYVENLAGDSIRKMGLYKWHVDDIIIIGSKGEDVNCLSKELNTSQKHISLTCEEEENNQLPFLDILISRRDDGSIQRPIYREPTWTG